MTAVGYDDYSGQLVITDNGVYGARTLRATMEGDGHVRIVSIADRSEFFVPWSDVTDLRGGAFSTPGEVLAYLQAEFVKYPVTGSPLRTYAVAVADGQTVIPLDPAPIDVNTLTLTVNSASYGPPHVAASDVAATWLGEFQLAATDDVRVAYF
jgi:hypothetical protein